MSKKLYFLISFVLVLGFSSVAQAWTSIDDPNYNLSFEYDSNGGQMYCSTRVGCESEWDPNYVSHCGVMAWLENDVDWPIVEMECSQSPGGEGCECKEGVFATDGICDLTVGQYGTITDANLLVWQSLDPTYDANVIIQPSYEYKLTYDTFNWGTPILKAYLFYGYIADNNLLDVDVNVIVEDEPTVTTDWLTYSISFVAEAGQPYIGEPLGIRFFQTGEGWYWIDDVRVEFRNLAAAHDPDPADGAEDVPMDVNLSWSPGLWAADVNGHEVYFGTDEAAVEDATTATTGIYRGPNDVAGPDANNRYSYDVPETLELGKTYYWRIDEVNEDWVSGHVPPVNDRWKGNVWSFRTTGLAYNVYPADMAVDIPALNLLLRWEAGTGAGSHDVYFGSDEAAVEDANTSTTGVFRDNWPDVNDPNYPVPEALEVGESYYWRIDEVNTISGTFVKGDVWSFTTGVFLIVDSFEWYQTHQELRAVWKDYSADPESLNGAELKIKTEADDANMIYGGEQSMEYYFRNINTISGKYVGSEAEADTADLEIGSNWTAGGVKALVVNFYGDPCNGTDSTWLYGGIYQDQMYVALEDGDANVGLVQYPEMDDIKQPSWHAWNISLADPCLAGVDMNNVAKVYIGFGGQKVGQTKRGAGDETLDGDTVWFDEIRLYPPRCLPTEVDLPSLGDIGGGEEGAQDCNTDYLDLEIMASDWASTDGLALTENRPAALTGFPDSTSHWVQGHIGSGAIDVNEGYDIDVTDPRLYGLTSMSITCWIKQTVDNKWKGVVSSRESVPGCGDDATEIGVYGAVYGGPDGLGYDWSCGTEEWQFDAELDVPADGTWTFIAMSVDPTGCTLYMKPDDGELQTGLRNDEEHPAQQNFAYGFTIGSDDKEPRNYFIGTIDDVRIYGYALSFADINNLAYETATEPDPPPAYWYKFDDGSGLSASDSGTPIEVYTMNMSPANLVPKDPNESEDPNLGSNAFDPNNMDIVNFLDYKIMAEHWLEGPFLWPPE